MMPTTYHTTFVVYIYICQHPTDALFLKSFNLSQPAERLTIIDAIAMKQELVFCILKT